MLLFYIEHLAYEPQQGKQVPVGKVLIAAPCMETARNNYRFLGESGHHRLITTEQQATAYGLKWHGMPDVLKITAITNMFEVIELVQANGVVVINEM